MVYGLGSKGSSRQPEEMDCALPWNQSELSVGPKKVEVKPRDRCVSKTF